MSNKPNLLFIFTDQQRADTMSCYGNDLIKTPNLNNLADSSFVFENAYVSTPICTPSRSTIMTGTWPHTNGTKKNNIPLPEDVKTLAEMLPSDYKKAYHGKWHLGDEVICQHGFDEWVSIEDLYRVFYSKPEYLGVMSDYHNFLIEKGFSPFRKSEGAKVFPRDMAASLPEEYTKANFLGESASKFINDNKDRPWALYVNIFETHSPYNSSFNNLYERDSIPVPPTFMKDPPSDAGSLAIARKEETVDKLSGFGPNPDTEDGLNEDFWRETIAGYWGNVTLVDRAVGKILKALEDSGVADNTIVVYSSEHGDQLGEHNIIQKAVFYQQSIRVPMLIRVPWISKDHKMIPGHYGHIDTVPTLLDLMGVELPDHLQGVTRVPVLEGSEDLSKNDVVIDWTWRDEVTPGHPYLVETDETPIWEVEHRTLISHDNWKLTLGSDPIELYDLKNDPYEQTNLSNDPSESSRVEEMYSRLRKWQEETDDSLQISDPNE